MLGQNTEAQLAALEKAKSEKEAHGEFESEHPGGAAIKAMVESNVRGRWSARKYREARDLLLEAGFIREVTPAMATRPAEYELTERMLTPSRVGQS